MGVDYNNLSTWKTPDLMLRDSILMGRTRVMGMSQTAAIIHIVAFVFTFGTSLPINLAFGIRHAVRYRKFKEERMWIRQILGSRNVAYQGRGRWVDVNPNPNAAHHWNATQTAAQCVCNPTPRAQWPYNNPGAGHLVQGTPSAGHWVHVTPSGGHWVQATPGTEQTVHVTPTPHANNNLQMQFATPSGGHWVQPTPGIGQTVHVTPTPHAHNHLQVHYAQDVVSDLQQDFGNNNDYDQSNVAYDQSYFNC